MPSNSVQTGLSPRQQRTRVGAKPGVAHLPTHEEFLQGLCAG
ncbi:MAG TPA: hypothetical protein VHV81_17360 [Steroidobacteraceae bacterium]|nr:hypothetical protein [Steroidobacteraceae bacterium]